MFDADHKRLLRDLIDDVERAKHAAIMGPILNEVIGPDMVGMFGPPLNAGAVVQPKPALLCMFPRAFRPFPPPYPFDALVVYVPASIVQKARDHPIAVAS